MLATHLEETRFFIGNRRFPWKDNIAKFSEISPTVLKFGFFFFLFFHFHSSSIYDPITRLILMLIYIIYIRMLIYLYTFKKITRRVAC